MVEKIIENFDLDQICRSGQCFRMQKEENGMFHVKAGSDFIRLSQNGNHVTFFCSQEEFNGKWKDYFDLDTDYQTYIGQADKKDSYLMEAVEYGSGIRILKQDLWETIVSFLISQKNNITRIRRCVENICEKYGGERTGDDGRIYHAFPSPAALSMLGEDELKSCNLGYRSKYVVRSARMIEDGSVSLEKIRNMEYKEAKEELLRLFGVGEKVADCICLFALHHLQAFPIDTHIRQALEKNYPLGFPKEKYRGFQGVMQQYIFYYELFK